MDGVSGSEYRLKDVRAKKESYGIDKAARVISADAVPEY